MKGHPHKCHRRESYGAGWRTVGDLGGEGCGKARRSREREDVEHRIGARVLQWMPCLESERAEEGEGRFWSLALSFALTEILMVLVLTIEFNSSLFTSRSKRRRSFWSFNCLHNI